jgi:hypothetical protein
MPIQPKSLFLLLYILSNYSNFLYLLALVLHLCSLYTCIYNTCIHSLVTTYIFVS